MVRNLTAVMLMAILTIGLVAACGRDDGTKTTVELKEWSVVPPSNTFRTGPITFEAKNVGTRTHELVIKRLGGATPQLIGEIESIPGGQSKSKEFTMTPGRYELSCELVEQEGGQTINHYQLGMHTDVTVE